MRVEHQERLRLLEIRYRTDLLFRICAVAMLLVGLGTLATLLADVFLDGAGKLSWSFLTSFPSRKPEDAGVLSALVGTLYLMLLTAAISFPIGVAAAVYLEEHSKTGWFSQILEFNIANLAGVPSIIYALLGLELFVRAMNLERSLLAGSFT